MESAASPCVTGTAPASVPPDPGTRPPFVPLAPVTDALRAAGWQPVEPLPCGCTPERLCAPHGWLRDAEAWEAYLDCCASCLDTCTHTGAS